MSLFYISLIFVIVVVIVETILSFKYLNTDEDPKERHKMFPDDYERPGFFRRMALKWKFEWKHLPRDIRIGFKNLYQWFKIIWTDRHWDHTYLLQIMKFKIERMADYHESRKFYVGWENNVKWMRTCCRLIDKIVNSEYETEYHDMIDSDIWLTPISGSDHSTVDIETTRDDLDEYFDRYPLQITKAKLKLPESVKLNETDNRRMLAHTLGHHNEERAQKLLFKIMNEHLQKWWD